MTISTTMKSLVAGTFAAALLVSPIQVFAGGTGDHSHDVKKMDHSNMAGGMPGNAKWVKRTINIVASDTAFSLPSVTVKDGEHVRFVVENKGELLHEFTLGDTKMQKAHQKEMMKMMDEGKLEADRIVGDAKHAHGNSIMLAPGEKKEIIWMFHKAANVEFGCNVPGHYESGMKGTIKIEG